MLEPKLVARETWSLPSGQWQRFRDNEGYQLTKTPSNGRVHPTLELHDVAQLTGARCADGLFFPPEFRYSPTSGKALPASLTTSPALWVPPHGASLPAAGSARLAVRGLSVTATPLELDMQRTRSETAEADAELDLPPAGHYEFFVAPTASAKAELLALDPTMGALYLWLVGARRWAALEHAAGGVLAESGVPREAWRCELVCAETQSRIFLPSSAGLASVVPCALELSYEVRYVGGGPACGSPIHWADRIWVPVRDASGSLRLCAADMNGDACEVVAVTDDVKDGIFAAPVSTDRQAIWPGRHGQLVLGKCPAGGIEATYLPWEPTISPAFQFGSPYLSRTGVLWQLCWNGELKRYVYLQLGRPQPELQSALAPRLCTGNINYRFAARMKLPPWEEPEHGDDGSTDELLMPLLESTVDSAVIGVEIASTAGLQSVLNSDDRFRAVLVLQADHHPETRFFSFAAPCPWQGRIFVHDGKLWFYHPELNRIKGWSLKL